MHFFFIKSGAEILEVRLDYLAMESGFSNWLGRFTLSYFEEVVSFVYSRIDFPPQIKQISQ